MAQGKEPKWVEVYKKLTVMLQDPFMLRVTVLAVLAVFGLGGVGLPLYENIQGLRQEFVQEKKRGELIGDYHSMDSYMKKHKKRIPKNADLDWWIAYMLDASREAKMQIIEYKPYIVKGGQAKVGSLQGVLLVFKLTGRFEDVLEFVGSLENRPEVMRIARIVLLPGAPVGVNVPIAVLTSKSKVGAAAAGSKGEAVNVGSGGEDEKETSPAASGSSKAAAAAHETKPADGSIEAKKKIPKPGSPAPAVKGKAPAHASSSAPAETAEE